MAKKNPFNNEEIRKPRPFNEESGYEAYTHINTLKQHLLNLQSKIDPEQNKLDTQDSITKIWAEIAGDSILSHTEAIYLKDDVLQIWVDSPVWASQMNMLRLDYKEKFNQKNDELKIKDVKIFTKQRRNRNSYNSRSGLFKG